MTSRLINGSEPAPKSESALKGEPASKRKSLMEPSSMVRESLRGRY